LNDRFLSALNLSEIEPPSGEEKSRIRTNYLRPEDILKKEHKLVAAMLQMQSKEDSLPTVRSNIDENSILAVTPDKVDTANQEDKSENNVAKADNKAAVENDGVTSKADKTSDGDDKAAAEAVMTASKPVGNKIRQKVIVVVGAISVLACVIGGLVYIRQGKKGK